MPATDPTLTTFYAEWQVHHEHLRAALAPLTDEQLAFRTHGLPGLEW
ncbi:MAG TPA: hypothetical protein VGR57_05200 [Ktedonobacterales bacterium]|nr:hypothetical protein [Ktedonobacterales bacterium]